MIFRHIGVKISEAKQANIILYHILWKNSDYVKIARLFLLFAFQVHLRERARALVIVIIDLIFLRTPPRDSYLSATFRSRALRLEKEGGSFFLIMYTCESCRSVRAISPHGHKKKRRRENCKFAPGFEGARSRRKCRNDATRRAHDSGDFNPSRLINKHYRPRVLSLKTRVYESRERTAIFRARSSTSVAFVNASEE